MSTTHRVVPAGPLPRSPVRSARAAGRFGWIAVVLALLLPDVLAGASASRAQMAIQPSAGPVRLGPFLMPETVSGARRGALRDYESTNKGFGQSVGYSGNGGLTFTVYVYDKGLRITDSNAPAISQAELDDAIRAIRQAAQMSGAQVEALAPVNLGTFGSVSRFHVTARDGQSYDTYVAVGILEHKILKVRATGAEGPATMEEVKAFLLALSTTIGSKPL